MAKKFFQSAIFQMKDSIDRTIGVMDDKGVIIACSRLTDIGNVKKEVSEEMSYSFDVVKWEGYTYKPMGTHAHIDYIVFVEGEDELAQTLVSFFLASLTTLKTLYDEKYDKSNFIKNIILENILPGDIVIKANELRFESEVNRVVYFIHFEGTNPDVIPYDIVQTMVSDKTKDYVINVGENDVALVRELRTSTDIKHIDTVAKTIVDTALAEFYLKSIIGIGTIVSSIKDLARSYKDAKMALSVGSVFEPKKNIIHYDNLGIGRLLYQLPATSCEMFLQEVFKRSSLESLDRETLTTIQTFFENNLNVSETSRKLFVHRNTLVYRLEKIKKITGLDLREFEHAITFKVALMVEKYVNSKPTIF